MRKTIFDIIDEIDTNRITEATYLRIQGLFFNSKIIYNGANIAVEKCISMHLFKKWKYREVCTDIFDFTETYNIPLYADFLTFNDFLINAEFILNILYLLESETYQDSENIITTIKENIQYILDKFNYKVVKIESDKFIIIEKSEIVSEIAVLNEDIAPQIIEYSSNSVRGDANRKKELILRIAHKYEGIEHKLKNNNNNDLVKILGTLLNNLDLRHNNVVGKKSNEFVKNLSDAELEQWYDKTYDTLLYALMTSTYIDNKNEINQLNESLKPSNNLTF